MDASGLIINITEFVCQTALPFHH